MNFALQDVSALKSLIGDAAEVGRDGDACLPLGGGTVVDTGVSISGLAGSANSINHPNGTDRRGNHKRRERLSRMSREELIRELMTDALTGLPNGRAYDEAPRQACQAVLDVAGLKWVNDHHGHLAGDALICAMAAALQEAGLEAYRVHGDEFVCQFVSKAEARVRLIRLAQQLQKTTFSFPAENGTERSYRGIGIRYGIGHSLATAEFDLVRARDGREKSGLLAKRGAKPTQMIEVG